MGFFLKSQKWDNERHPLQQRQLAITPHMGYDPQHGKSSQMARCYLRWLMHQHADQHPDEPPLVIRYWDSPEGEKKLCGGRYSVDGYIQRPGHPGGDKAVEVFGCFWVCDFGSSVAC